MREILFRGKRVDNGQWVEGYYYPGFQDTSISFILCKHDGIVYEVLPETVGQFTGLFDKNRKRIFEGDIVKSEYNSELFSVKYLDGSFVGDNSDFEFGILSNFELTRSEIIGNIHDNPELLNK